MTVYLTSDEHIDHSNIIKYCNRPFKDINHMREEMINRHNDRVAQDDDVWHLGDFCLNKVNIEHILKRLNGRHKLICGNHDKCHPCHKSGHKLIQYYLDAGFVSVDREIMLQIEGLGNVKLSHMPYANDSHHDARYIEWRPKVTEEDLLLHSHVHEKWKIRGKAINVGVDVWDFRPVSIQEIIDTLLLDAAVLNTNNA